MEINFHQKIQMGVYALVSVACFIGKSPQLPIQIHR